jgi:methionyl-tRNA formyltransferase
MARPNIVFMGTPEFAVPSLEACASLGNVVLVVTQPDRPRGRGQKVSPSPVKAWAVAHEVAVAQPERLKGNDFDREVAKVAPDVAVVAAYGRILPANLLAVPRRGCVNVHASILPRYRGAAPIQWAIVRGEKETGVSLMCMEAGLDTGPVFSQRRIPITSTDTGGSLSLRLATLGAEMLTSDLPGYLDGRLAPSAQDSAAATLAPLIKKEDSHLDFAQPAEEIERRVRAFDPAPGCFFVLDGQPFKVWRASTRPGGGEAGAIVHADGRSLSVACGTGTLDIQELTPPGKRRMSAAEFLVGRRLTPGTKLNAVPAA